MPAEDEGSETASDADSDPPPSNSELSQYNLETPARLWSEWSLNIPRTYSRYADRLVELVAVDVACRKKHGEGAVETLVENDLLEWSEVDILMDENAGLDQFPTVQREHNRD